jgi:hypothetical protein
MKKIILMLVLISNGVIAQTTYIYGPQGQNAGTVVKSGNTTYFYGAQGQNVGTATTSGNTTYVYGSQGQNIGTMTNPTPMFAAPSYAPNPTSLTPMYDSIFGR